MAAPLATKTYRHPATGRPRRRMPTGRLVDRFLIYAGIAPFYVLFLVFGLVPVGYGIYLSLHSWDGLGPISWVGLGHYTQLLTDPAFWMTVSNTVVIYLLGTVPMLIASLLAAFAVGMAGRRVAGLFQTMSFLPNVTSIVAAAVVFQSLFNPEGLLNLATGMLGLPAVPWMSDPFWMKVAIALLVAWQGFGYFVLIFLAGLGTISPSLYEAARLDGAGSFTILFRISLPMLRPVVIFTLLTASVGMMQVVVQPQVLFGDNGGPAQGGMTVMLYQYVYGFHPDALGGTPDYGYASAVGWVVFVLLVGISALNWGVIRKYGNR